MITDTALGTLHALFTTHYSALGCAASLVPLVVRVVVVPLSVLRVLCVSAVNPAFIVRHFRSNHNGGDRQYLFDRIHRIDRMSDDGAFMARLFHELVVCP